MTIRAKLTLINAGVIAIVTLCMAVIIFAATSSDLRNAVDRELISRGQVAQRLFARDRTSDGGLRASSGKPLDPAELSLRQPRIFDETDLSDPEIKVWDKQSLILVRQSGDPILTTLTLPAQDGLPEQAIRVLTMRIDAPKGAGSSLQVAASLDSVREESERMAIRLAVLLPVIWLAALAGGWFLTNSALKPIGRLARDSQSLLDGNPRLRLPDQDPDEMGSLARVINQGLDKIEAGYRRLERFAGDASHELKSPLTAILLRATSAPQDNPQAMASNLEAIRKSARGMTAMINDLLLAAKLDESSGQSGSKSCVKESILAALDGLGESDAARVSVEAPEGLEVRGDSYLIERAVGNLVLNSLQHGGEGVEVRVSAERSGPDIVITVADTGPGIDPEDLPFIFERFYRGDSARTHGDGWQGQGSGLGLAITQAIVSRLGGTIACESVLGQGATMVVSLPSAGTHSHAEE